MSKLIPHTPTPHPLSTFCLIFALGISSVLFSAEHIRFFCLYHSRLKLVSDAGKHIPPSIPCTSRTQGLLRNVDNVQYACHSDSLRFCHDHSSRACSSSSKVSSTAGQRVLLPQKRSGALLHWAELPLQKHHSLKPTIGVRGANGQNCLSWIL